MQPLSAAGSYAESRQAMNTLVQKTMENLRQAQQDQLQKEIALQEQSTNGRPDLVNAMIEAYGVHNIAELPALPHSQPTEYDRYDLPVDPAARQAYLNLLNPPVNSTNMNLLQEDLAWMQNNLAYAQKPASVEEYMRRQQDRAMANAQFAAHQELIKQQTELAQAQRQAIQQQYRMPPVFTAKANISHSPSQALFRNTPWYQKIQQQKLLSDTELKQMFHDFELQRHSQNASEVVQAEIKIKNILAKNMSSGPFALRHKDGYIIISTHCLGNKLQSATGGGIPTVWKWS